MNKSAFKELAFDKKTEKRNGAHAGAIQVKFTLTDL